MMPLIPKCAAYTIFAAALCSVAPAVADQNADDVERAVSAAQNGKAETAISILRPLARDGVADAQYFLGRMLSAGQGTVKDPVEAVKWWKLAANQGHAEAMFMLGVAYGGGLGVSEDHVEAAKWMILADAEDGFTFALLLEQLSPEDLSEARRRAADWQDSVIERQLAIAAAAPAGIERLNAYRSLAENGVPEAQFELGSMYESGVWNLQRMIMGKEAYDVKPDPAKAMELYRKAAEQGYGPAQVSLALGMLGGPQSGEQSAEAVAWLKRAAAQGHPNAYARLGEIYLDGIIVKRDQERALEYIRPLVARGDPYMMHLLGLAYADGRIQPIDYRKSYMWLLTARKAYKVNYWGSIIDDEIDKSLEDIGIYLSSNQKEDATKDALECIEKNYKDCGNKSLIDILKGLLEYWM